MNQKRLSILMAVLAACGLACAESRSEPLRLYLRVADTSTGEPLQDFEVKLIRDFPQASMEKNLSHRDLEPFQFFSTCPPRSESTATQAILGYIKPDITESGGVLQTIVPYEQVASASNLWVELTKNGYYPALRNLFTEGKVSAGLHLSPKLALAPMKTSITDFSQERTVKQAGIEIVIPAEACDPGTEIFVDVQTGVSGSQYLSYFAPIFSYPVAVWPPEVKFKKPLRVKYTAEALKGLTGPRIFRFGRINPTDYSLSHEQQGLPNDGSTIEPPFEYTSQIHRGGLYVLSH